MAHDEGLVSAQFSPDGKRILTSCWDNTARLWDVQVAELLGEPLKHGTGWLNPAKFSPDGRRIFTSAGNIARLWDVAPATGKYPDWLLPLTEAISGEVLNERGLLEPTKLDRVKVINEIRRQLNAQTGDDDWVIWGRWLLADRARRTISPFSKITVPEYLRNQTNEPPTQPAEGQNR
jgi:WD40 repeat protein